MKNTKVKIILIVVLSNIIIASLIGTFIVLNTFDAFKDVAIKRAVEITETYALIFDDELLEVEDIATATEIVVETLIDMDKLELEPNYLDTFEVTLSPIIEKLAKTGTITQSAYVFFDPSLDEQVHDIWYTDLNHDGVVNRQDEFQNSFYDNLGSGDEWYTVPFYGNRVYWTQPYFGSVDFDSDILYVSHTRPIEVDNKMLGVVGSDYHFDLMKETIGNLSLYNTGYGMLVNEKGEIIVHPTIEIGSNLRDFNSGSYSWMIDEMEKSNNGIFKYKWINGNDKFMTYQKLENGWFLSITVEENEVFAWYQRLIVILVIITVVFTTLIIALSYKLSNRITKPIYELADYVDAMKFGSYEDKIPETIITRNDELGQLGNSIENMRINLRSGLNEIKSYAQILEIKVNDRTEQIHVSQLELKDAIENNKKQNADVECLNNKMDSVLKKLEETQLKLIESEKITSMNSVMARIVLEFNRPLLNFNESLFLMKEIRDSVDEKVVTEMLSKQDLVEFSEKFNSLYSTIMDDLNRIKILVEKFKALDPESSHVNKTSVDMNVLLNVLVESIDYPDYVKIYSNCPEGLIITLDTIKLSQIFVHLIENAIKHAFVNQEDGVIQIDISYDKALFITVKDNGCGMSKEESTKIFNPVYSYDSTMGYGLNIVYNIVQKTFNGTINYTSKIGEGTEFNILINI